MDIEWEDPSAVKAGRPAGPVSPKSGKYSEFFAELRKHPGRWAVMPLDSKEHTVSSNVQSVKRGMYTGAEPGEFDATARRTMRGYKVYVRYIGGEKDAPAE